jgi:predicted MFS family arabinose efflux permease
MSTTQSAPAVSGGYRAYVLVILTLIYTSNFIDRGILGVLGQPIKAELGLSDWQLGVLGGLAFAILYSTLGIPVARLAERTNRVTLMAVAVIVWSGMTALCAFVGNFWHLLAARVGVGIGEAGCAPPVNSILADYFPPNRRATAIGIFSLGIPIGSVAGALIGSWVADNYGWRAAFLVVGLPGIALAILFKLTVREPVRGAFDPPGADRTAPSVMEVVRHLAGKKAFIHLALGSAMASFGAYGISTFAIPYLLRGFPLTLTQAGAAYALFGGVAAAVGVASGGLLADWAGKRDARVYVLMPAAAFAVATPLYMAAFLQSSLTGLALFVCVPAILQFLYIGPMTGLTQNMVGPRSRATTSAILTLVINLIGLGLGPALTGWASDLYATAAYAGVGEFAAACPGGLAPAGASAEATAACGQAAFIGLQRALVTVSAVFLWAGLHFLLAARTVRRDLEI